MKLRKISWKKGQGKYWSGRVSGEIWFYIRGTADTLTLKRYVFWSVHSFLGGQKSFDTLDECKREAEERIAMLVNKVCVDV